MKFIITVALILLIFSGCGRKLNPTLEDYIQPEPVEKISLSVFHDKITVSWSYPEKMKKKVKSFLVEKENNGQIKSLGFFDVMSSSCEDRDFKFGQIYKYRIYAINIKGIYSKPAQATVKPEKLPEVEDLQYKITDSGIFLSWKAEDSLMYNIYQINQKGEKVKRGSTGNNIFLDELTSSAFDPEPPEFLIYLVSSYISDNYAYIESKGTEINIPVNSFIPSRPEHVFWAVNENGVSISWREVPERWIKGYRVYRKTFHDQDFIKIGETMIPSFFDADYNINNLKMPVYYRIFSAGPVKESEPVEIKVEVTDG
uniref:Fibronectin type III domain-containing protein n=1 Tax=Thermodesulfovibrio aggregans TaxID=86166 RepID=A0A7C4EK47_9BACT